MIAFGNPYRPARGGPSAVRLAGDREPLAEYQLRQRFEALRLAPVLVRGIELAGRQTRAFRRLRTAVPEQH